MNYFRSPLQMQILYLHEIVLVADGVGSTSKYGEGGHSVNPCLQLPSLPIHLFLLVCLLWKPTKRHLALIAVAVATAAAVLAATSKFPHFAFALENLELLHPSPAQGLVA